MCVSTSQVCILFSEIVGFEDYCNVHSPTEVVRMISTLFAAFDKLLSKHEVFKVSLSPNQSGSAVICKCQHGVCKPKSTPPEPSPTMCIACPTGRRRISRTSHAVAASAPQVETVGSCYMVASGLPFLDPTAPFACLQVGHGQLLPSGHGHGHRHGHGGSVLQRD